VTVSDVKVRYKQTVLKEARHARGGRDDTRRIRDGARFLECPQERSPLTVTVIIPTLNRPSVLRRTLATVFASSVAPNQLFVVDQSDRPDSDLESFLRSAPNQIDIQYIHQRPPNAQRARNRAATAATGDVLLFLDDDILLERDLIAAHLKNYIDPSVGAVGGMFLEPGEEPTGKLPPRYFRKHTGWIYFPHGYTRRSDAGIFPSCNGSIRRELLFAAGGFDENYCQTLLDDTDLSCRLRRLGVRIMHDPEARALHLKEEHGGNRPRGINEYVIANSSAWEVWWYFFGINFGWRAWPEIAIRFRGCVLRRVSVMRPWYLALALFHCVRGGLRAVGRIRQGRKLPLLAAPDSYQT
jgi:GT2 family glycosyltransferase